MKLNSSILTISNAISIVRLVLTIPIAMLLLDHQYETASWLCLLAAATDWLDGWVARLTHTESEWGKILDPLADKVLVGVVVVIMVYLELLPLWFVLSVLTRDVVILLGGLYVATKSVEVPPSLWSGKLAVAAISLAGYSALLQNTTVMLWSMILAMILMTISLWEYAKRLHGIIRQTQENT
ncbi:MAG: CDP-alcohol phosphatidyltransferase family protein [Bradyrhizobiaceae bacterium]|nr:CDP-alcohol phosphatidyltransferase family protein [Bradyrhizobiaceae bacterium]